MNHSSPLWWYEWILKTFMRLLANFHWPNMKRDVQKFIQQSITCQEHKVPHYQTCRLITASIIPNQFWEDLSMEFVTCLSDIQIQPLITFFSRISTILVVVDRLSKYAQMPYLTLTYRALLIDMLWSYMAFLK